VKKNDTGRVSFLNLKERGDRPRKTFLKARKKKEEVKREKKLGALLSGRGAELENSVPNSTARSIYLKK